MYIYVQTILIVCICINNVKFEIREWLIIWSMKTMKKMIKVSSALLKFVKNLYIGTYVLEIFC